MWGASEGNVSKAKRGAARKASRHFLNIINKLSLSKTKKKTHTHKLPRQHIWNKEQQMKFYLFMRAQKGRTFFYI